MTSEKKLNAWGEPVAPEDPDDPYSVPKADRKLSDEGPGANALERGEDGIDTGDDITGAEDTGEVIE